MTNNSSRRPTVADVQDAVDDDILDMSDEELTALMSEIGLDYDQVGEQGERFVTDLSRTHQRESWMAKADSKAQSISSRIKKSVDNIRQRTQALLDAGHPGLSAAFRGRSPSAMTEEELASIAEDLAIAELIGTPEDD